MIQATGSGNENYKVIVMTLLAQEWRTGNENEQPFGSGKYNTENDKMQNAKAQLTEAKDIVDRLKQTNSVPGKPLARGIQDAEKKNLHRQD